MPGLLQAVADRDAASLAKASCTMSSRSSSSQIRRRRKERSFGASSRYMATNWRSSYTAAAGAHAPSFCCTPYICSGAPDEIEGHRRTAAFLNGRQHDKTTQRWRATLSNNCAQPPWMSPSSCLEGISCSRIPAISRPHENCASDFHLWQGAKIGCRNAAMQQANLHF